MKVCKRCGAEKPLSEFRPYYGQRSGTYTYCKECEKIEERRKYLIKRSDSATPAQKEELAKINELYELRRAAGLQVPCSRQSTVIGVSDIVDAQLQSMKKTQVN